jgi:alpha-mannosidase
VGPDGESVLAGLNPGSYDGGIETDLSKPLRLLPPDAALQDIQKKLQAVRAKLDQEQGSGHASDTKDIEESVHLRDELNAFTQVDQDRAQAQHQGDWAGRVELNGKVSGVFTDYHYYGTGDIGGAPREKDVARLEAIVTQGMASRTASCPAKSRAMRRR